MLELARQQEVTRAQELKTKEAQAQATVAQAAAERERVHFEELRKSNQQQAQLKAQMARYDDELARQRAAKEHEQARERNAETVRMQEVVAERQEALRRATEEKIQQERRATEAMKAEIDRETLRAKALADAEGRAAEARANEDVNRRLMVTRVEAETAKAVQLLNAAAQRFADGTRALLNDPRQMGVAIGGVTALALGVYGAREGSRVGFRYLERILGQPALVRETSRRGLLSTGSPTSAAAASGDGPFRGVVLQPRLLDRLSVLASATGQSRAHGAPFRNMLFYGPPGTGKTLAAKRLARTSGLDYAIMSGGDVAPLGPRAVTAIHELFDWSGTTSKGVLLFIDEADAFLSARKAHGEDVRAALNALLFRTGAPSRDIALVLATNRPGDLDEAVLDRMDEALEFPLPGQQERAELLKLYFKQYIEQPAGADADADVAARRGLLTRLFRSRPSPPAVKVQADVNDALFESVAAQTEGFSGRELAKLMASVQAAVYGRKGDMVLDAATLQAVVAQKVAEHKYKSKLARESGDGR